MPEPPFVRISNAEAAAARSRYGEASSKHARELAQLDHVLLLSRALSGVQYTAALAAEVEALKAFIHHARLAGADAARVLRDEALRLQFTDEYRRRRGL